MTRRIHGMALALGALLLAAVGPAGAGPALDEREALKISQAALGRQIGDHAFVDTARGQVRLSDFRGRPLVINLVYTGCTGACPLVIQNLHPAIAAAQDALGRDAFTVATIGFDARNDTPERMRGFARTQGVDLPNWVFLAADQGTIDRLAADVGFVVFPSPQGFDHAAQVTIVDGDGVVYRQVYGGAFDVPAVVEPLKQLVFGRASDWTSIEGILNRVRLFCTLYDPGSDRYRFDWSVFIGMAVGAGSLLAVGLVLVREWRRSGRGRASV